MENVNTTSNQPGKNESGGISFINKEKTDQLVAEVKKATNEMVTAAKSMKEKYDKSDEMTKKKVMAGIGIFALIMGLIGLKKAHKCHHHGCCKRED
jgi:hypothetical protein